MFYLCLLFCFVLVFSHNYLILSFFPFLLFLPLVNPIIPLHTAAYLRWVNLSEVATKLASFFFLHINLCKGTEVEDWVCSAWTQSYRKGNQGGVSYLLKSQKGSSTHCDLSDRKAMGCANSSGHLKVWMCLTHLCLLPLVFNPFWSCWAWCWKPVRIEAEENQITNGPMLLWPRLCCRWRGQREWKNIFQFISQSFICVLYHICLNKDRRMYPTKDLLWLYMNGNILFLQLRQKIKTDFSLWKWY